MINNSLARTGYARGLVLGVGLATLAGVLTAPSAHAVLAAAGPAVHQPFTAGTAVQGNRFILRLRSEAAGSSTPGVEATALRRALEAAGAHLVAAQPRLGLAVAEIPPSSLAAVAALPVVASVAADSTVRPTSLGGDARGQAGALAAISSTIGASAMWKRGFTGAGVDVALLDTGIAPMGGFANPAKIVVGPDLSFESRQVGVRSMDTYGHGTNMAGIIAGREGAKAPGAAYARDDDNFLGVAPDARVVSVKLADYNGAVDVSQLIAAIDWVVQNQKRDGMNIRVMNISYATASRNDAQADPLAWAAESAWRAGVVVVASAGNDAERAGTAGLSSPAFNPWLLAVGAADTKGTAAYTDDTVPGFSQRGAGAEGRGPDLLAPGVGIVSLGVKGSKLATDHPAALVGSSLLRGSGTSQAAAVVSGAVALVLQQHPWMSPDDVKGHLRSSATRLAGVTTQVQGAGELNLARALDVRAIRSPQSLPVGHGHGTLERARGGHHVSMDGVKLAGEKDVMGSAWSSPVMSAAAARRSAWKPGGVFNGATWIGQNGLAVDTSTWTGAWNDTWSGRVWKGDAWSGRVWKGDAWSGRVWKGGSWSGRSWSGRTWSGADFSAAKWTGNGWSAGAWRTPVDSPTWAGRVWTSDLWN